MIFIKPTILRDNIATTFATNEKYEAIRNMQLAEAEKERKLLRELKAPIIQPFDDSVNKPSEAIDLRNLESSE